MVISKLRMQVHLSAIMKQEAITAMPLSPLDFLESFCYLIGNPDSMLRADLMEPVFKTFGENADTFSNEECADIMMRLTSKENLTYEIHNGRPSLIFKRSYSALVIACLLWRQQQNPFLSEGVLSVVYERLSPAFMSMSLA